MDIQINVLVKDSFDTYKSVEAINASFLKQLKTSPLSALNPQKGAPSKAMQFGSLYHKYLLEHDTFFDEYFIFDESKRPNPKMTMAAAVNKDWKVEQLANEKRIIIDKEDYKKAGLMGSQLNYNNPFAIELLKNCETEVSLYTKLKLVEHGEILVKCRFDAINIKEGYIVDLKTAADASPFGFSRDAGKYGYHIQAAFYMFLARRVFKKDFKLYFVTQETNAPFNNAIYNVSDSMRLKGENELTTLLPAATYVKKVGVNVSYNAFTSNENQVFDLDIPSYYAEPKEFYFN